MHADTLFTLVCRPHNLLPFAPRQLAFKIRFTEDVIYIKTDTDYINYVKVVCVSPLKQVLPFIAWGSFYLCTVSFQLIAVRILFQCLLFFWVGHRAGAWQLIVPTSCIIYHYQHTSSQ